jgi:nucleotide-binding universal stress UspA family protein
MYRILLPVDTDVERSLAQARFVANLPGATEEIEVVIVHSFTARVDHGAKDVRETQTAADVRSVREVTDYLEEAGIEHELIDGAGNPAEVVLDVAADDAPDQIVMGGRRRTAVGKALFGSVTQSVVLDTNVPVTVVRE